MLLGGSACRAEAAPGVSLAYHPHIDTACSLIRSGSIEREWKAELAARMPEFERIWKEVGPQFTKAVKAITGEPLLTEHVTAYLTLCNLPSQSIAGISVNMRSTESRSLADGRSGSSPVGHHDRWTAPWRLLQASMGNRERYGNGVLEVRFGDS